MVVWASGTVCISLYKMVPSAHEKANFLLGSRRTGARKEGFLARGGRGKKTPMFAKLLHHRKLTVSGLGGVKIWKFRVNHLARL